MRPFAAKTHHPPGSHQGSQGCSRPRRPSAHRSRDRHWLGPLQHPLPKENSERAHHNQHILMEKGNILPYRPVRGGSSGLIGKGTGQPGLDAESHGRNSPATTVRKQEGRELQGQQERRSKITRVNSKQKAGQATDWGNGLLSPTPSSLMDGAVSGAGQWCGKRGAVPTAAPQHLRLFPTDGGTAQAEGSSKGSALRPPRSPAEPQQARHRFSQTHAVMAGVWGLVRARQPAQKLLSHGLQHRLCPLPQCHRPGVAVTVTRDQEHGQYRPSAEPCPIRLPQPHAPWQPCPSSPSLQQMLVQRNSQQGFLGFLLTSHTISSVSRSNPS